MIDKLRKIPLFGQFGDDELSELSTYVTQRNCSDGECVFREGDEGDSMYIIGAGQVEIRKKSKALAVFDDGLIFGEMALYEKTRRSADALSRGSSTLYQIRNEDFHTFLSKHPKHGVEFLYHSIREMSRRLRATTEYLMTVFETGRISGANHNLWDMCEKIVGRLVGDITDATGGLVLLVNPFSEEYQEAYQLDFRAIGIENAIGLLKQNPGATVRHQTQTSAVLGVPLRDEDRILGYLLIEKANPDRGFSSEEEIIVSAVGNQVGLGILNAYHRQEEEDRKRLEQGRMRGY